MKKWYDEEYEFTVEAVGFLRGDHTEHYCRNGEEIGDTYTCTYGCPVNRDGYGICSKTMMMLHPLMEDVCGKNAELTLQSRVKGFRKCILEELLYADWKLVDYADKELSIV